MPGMLLHIDGSKHQWFGDERWYDLIVILDDATSEVYYAQLVEEESTRTVMAALREVIETQGLFCALYMFVIVVVPLIGVDIRNHSMIVKVALSVSGRSGNLGGIRAVTAEQSAFKGGNFQTARTSAQLGLRMRRRIREAQTN